MTRRLIAHGTLALLSAVLVTASGRADPAAQARFHDEVARREYAANRFENALREFFLEQRISPNPRIAFNIALCFQALKRPEESFHYFSEYIASDDRAPERRGYAERKLAELRRSLALIHVVSAPAGATIYVDRKELGSYGQTPTVIALAPGEHQVMLELEGYRPSAAPVVAERGREIAIELEAVRILGRLRVQSALKGGASVHGGSGETLVSGALPLVSDLPPGDYEVRVNAHGYLPWTGLANIEADQELELSPSPQVAPALSGDITVTSSVPGALVELNGQPAGFAPTVLTGVPVGPQQLRLRAASMIPWSGKVSVSAEERSWLTVSLEEQHNVQRSSATWIAGGVGIGSLAVGGVFAILAAQAHSDFENAPAGSDRTVLRDRGQTLNTIADVALATGLLALGTGVVLYFATAETGGARSSASVVRSKR
jgi:outer membrane receptor for ferrienterochelin and colicins